MALYKIVDNNPVPWKGEPINGISHPRNIEQLWSDAELQNIGLYKLIPGDDIPEGKEIQSESIQWVNGQVKVVRIFQDVDMSRRRDSMEISRLQLKAILLQYGLLSAVQAMIDAADEITKLAWNDAVTVRRNSPVLLGLAASLTWPNGNPVTETEIDTMFEEAHTLEF